MIPDHTDSLRLPGLVTGSPGRLGSTVSSPRQSVPMPRLRSILRSKVVARMSDQRPTIVLVHGAWADATGFDAEVRALQESGYTAVGFGNPLRDLAGDA